jgi:hypothetical protein
VAHLDRGILRPETLGLTLAEARSILAGIEQTLVERQAAEFVAQQRTCSHCGHERSCKGRHHIVSAHRLAKVEVGGVHGFIIANASRITGQASAR